MFSFKNFDSKLLGVLIVSASCVFISASSQADEHPTVRVADGLLAGSWQKSSDGRQYASFKGVPYARPPVGKYRFREPQYIKPWLGTWDASRFGAACLQYDPFLYGYITGSENCLFLNVYTPQLNVDSSLPVVVYIHGGAFMFGTTTPYGPENLMDKDIVVVTLNYRLGPLGFLSTNDDVVPGNMGLKDQAFALNWIKRNIKSFGGNPNKVTLTGQSAGGASVHYHYLSSLSKGTFQQGHAISGSTFNSWTITLKPEEKAHTLATHIGCPTNTSKEMVECLRGRPGESIVFAQAIFFKWNVNLFSAFTPVVEPPSSSNPFINQHPYFLHRTGQMHKLPLIFSVTSEEGLYPAAAYQKEPGILEDLEAKWDELGSYIFVYNDTVPVKYQTRIAQSIKTHYLKGQPVSQKTFPELVQALGDRLFVVGVGKAAQVHATNSGQPTYLYRFSHRGSSSLSNLLCNKEDNYGASHADDLFHFFSSDFVNFKQTPQDEIMTHIMIELWTSYATTGTPAITGVNWSPLDSGVDEMKYLEISDVDKLHMTTTKDFGLKSFWDSLGFKENENLLTLKEEL